VSYYMGDAYRGDYYRGDPGIASFFGGLVKKIGGAIFKPGGANGATYGPTMEQLTRYGSSAIGKVTGAIAKHPVLSAAGAAAGVGILGGMGAESLMGRAAPGAKGFHMSKARKGHPSHLVRNRHMRSTNPRALRRALRRVGGFAHFAKRVMHYTQPHRRGRLAFKFPKRRKRA